MDWRLLVASSITLGIAAAHSMLGEKRIVSPLLNMRFDFCRPERAAFICLTLRFTWHLTSLFILGCAALLLALAMAPIDVASILALEILGALFVASAAITGSYSKGRHIAWPLFACVGILSWWTAAWHEGAVSFDATKPAIGIAAASVLMLAGVIHLYWAVRRPTGLVAVIPVKNGKPLFRPGRIGTAAVATGLVLAGVILAEQATGLVQFAMPEVTQAGCWLLSAILIARAVGDFRYIGLFKTVQMTTFGYCDTAAYTPLCLLLGMSALAATL